MSNRFYLNSAYKNYKIQLQKQANICFNDKKIIT